MAMSAFRALQNPGLFRYEHYQQAALAVCAGILIRFLIAVPVSLHVAAKTKNGLIEFGEIFAVQALIWGSSFFINFESATWDEKLAGGLDFIANSVLQIPFFLMSFMRYITPTLDQM